MQNLSSTQKFKDYFTPFFEENKKFLLLRFISKDKTDYAMIRRLGFPYRANIEKLILGEELKQEDLEKIQKLWKNDEAIIIALVKHNLTLADLKGNYRFIQHFPSFYDREHRDLEFLLYAITSCMKEMKAQGLKIRGQNLLTGIDVKAVMDYFNKMRIFEDKINQYWEKL